MDEFAELKNLVESLRAALPPCREDQYQQIGIYMLAAKRLGAGEADFRRCIDDYFANKDSKVARLPMSRETLERMTREMKRIDE